MSHSAYCRAAGGSCAKRRPRIPAQTVRKAPSEGSNKTHERHTRPDATHVRAAGPPRQQGALHVGQHHAETSHQCQLEYLRADKNHKHHQLRDALGVHAVVPSNEVKHDFALLNTPVNTLNTYPPIHRPAQPHVRKHSPTPTQTKPSTAEMLPSAPQSIAQINHLIAQLDNSCT